MVVAFCTWVLNCISRSAGSFKLSTIIVGDPAGSQGKKRQHLKSTEASLQRCRGGKTPIKKWKKKQRGKKKKKN